MVVDGTLLLSFFQECSTAVVREFEKPEVLVLSLFEDNKYLKGQTL